MIHFIAGGEIKEPLSYKDLIKTEEGITILKPQEELKYKYDWWSYLQIKDLFVIDKKKFGFRDYLTEIETILTGDTYKIISKT